jgi:DNA repair photolyase
MATSKRKATEKQLEALAAGREKGKMGLGRSEVEKLLEDSFEQKFESYFAKNFNPAITSWASALDAEEEEEEEEEEVEPPKEKKKPKVVEEEEETPIPQAMEKSQPINIPKPKNVFSQFM